MADDKKIKILICFKEWRWVEILRRTKFLITVLTLAMLLTLATLARPAKASPPPTTISVDPPTITNVDLYTIFQVNITVDIGTNELFMWVISVSWDPNVLTLNRDPIEGPFLKEQVGQTSFTVAKIEEDYIEEMVCMSLSGEVATGSGVIVTLEFNGTGIGTSIIHLYGPPGYEEKPLWLDISGNIYYFDNVQDGSATVVPEFSATLLIFTLLLATLVTIVFTKKSKNSINKK